MKGSGSCIMAMSEHKKVRKMNSSYRKISEQQIFVEGIAFVPLLGYRKMSLEVTKSS